MRILALDQSTTATGCAFFIDDILDDYALIKPKISTKVQEPTIEEQPHICDIKMPKEMYDTTLCRTTVIADKVEEYIKSFKPDVVYFEEIFENRNPNGYRSLARLQGFLCHICHKYNVRYCIVEESRWIKTFGTYGREIGRSERKADVMQKINDRYGLDIKVDDVSDAIAIGAYAINVEKEKLI